MTHRDSGPYSHCTHDEPLLTIDESEDDRWLYLALRSRRVSLYMELQSGIAFHLHEWLSDDARTPSSGRRALGRVFCEVQWPACPNCLGEPLDCSRGIGSSLWCGEKWLADNSSCALAATHQLIDTTTGERNYICSSHAEHAREILSVIEGVVEPIPAISWSQRQ